MKKIRKGYYIARLALAYYMKALLWFLWKKNGFCKEWKKDNHKWVFIMGCNNSGTSLLYNVLGEHPEIGKIAIESANENIFFPSFVTNTLPSSYKSGVDRVWTEKPEIFRLTEESSRLDENRLRYDWLNMVKLKKRDPRPYLLEKTTENAIRSRWLQKVFPDSYFIGLVRNGYAVCEGIRRRKGYDIARIARFWNAANKIMLEDSRYLKNFKLITYEDLAENPEKALSEIAGFLNIDKAPIPGIVKNMRSSQNIYARSLPIQNLNQESIKRLSAENIEKVNMEAGEMLRKFGYYQET